MKLRYYIQKLLGKWLDTPIIPEGKTVGYSLVRSELYKVVKGKFVRIMSPYFLHNVEIGDYCVLSHNANAANVHIGKCCSIGPNFCCGLGLHPSGGISSSAMFYSTSKLNGMTLSEDDKYEESRQTFIGNDVYIGSNVFVLDGIHIADGAVVGAGAVVTKDIPPYAVAVGVPAKVVKYRFDEAIIKELLDKQWWNRPEEDWQLVEKYFWDVETFLKELK
jgi:acetyltransferase-like isoleucine patch superfamily enzyme